ncbi:phosphatase [Emticicia sp. CRIBPO]|uniref:Ppx/GppA phosphatase family protein n=1 Tax=Emticicia sp. CRIBPO TaxID=2683258 RepID=UPI0014130338|nr:phosphatase [Emticicia sp. CRIBPO]NBA84752.1 phosphatase [Emticicia sp. CRIBPO]
MKLAIIDLGTNTFHLLIVESAGGTELFKVSIPAKIGKGGINQNVITPEAIQRAMTVLRVFREKIDEYGLESDQVYAFGTSAIRNAENKEEFISLVKQELDIDITVIDGNEEADLIYKGVSQAVNISENSLIIDIGGGSVELIICDEEKILWKRSFEIGGQRLIEKFMKKDPIPQSDISRLNDYLNEQLLPLANAIHQYHPKVLIGSSGSFDTLNDMYYHQLTGNFPPAETIGFDYPVQEFWKAYESLVFSDRATRMAIPGMIELRVEMIVVAVCLIRFVIQNYGIEQIKISNYALKEGALQSILENHAR